MADEIKEFKFADAQNHKDKLEASAAEALQKALSNFIAQVEELYGQLEKGIDDFIESNYAKKLAAIFPDAMEWVGETRKNNPYFVSVFLAGATQALRELSKYKKENPDACSLFALLPPEQVEKNEGLEGNPLFAIFDKAADRQAAERQHKAITIKSRIERIDYPVDKLNSGIWNLLESDTGTQLSFAVGKANSKKPLNILYAIDFEGAAEHGLKISQKLDAFDKRVYIAAASLFVYGSDTMTLNQIYNAMGYDGIAGKGVREKINKALSKMQMAHIFIDNRQESDAYKYEHFRYDGYLLPLERVTRIVNGEVTEGVIHLLREPPMYSFARQRQQLTTLDRKVLQSPLNKTNPNLLLEDYLIERIARLKNGKGQKKILYKTIYEKTGLKTRKQRFDAGKKIETLLTHYKKVNYIKDFSLEKDGIIVSI